MTEQETRQKIRISKPHKNHILNLFSNNHQKLSKTPSRNNKRRRCFAYIPEEKKNGSRIRREIERKEIVRPPSKLCSPEKGGLGKFPRNELGRELNRNKKAGAIL